MYISGSVPKSRQCLNIQTLFKSIFTISRQLCNILNMVSVTLLLMVYKNNKSINDEIILNLTARHNYVILATFRCFGNFYFLHKKHLNLL